MAWRWAAASEIGTSHIKSGERLQDAFTVSTIGDECVLAIVSDGAGSAKFGFSGAWLACRVLKVRFREWFSENRALPEDETLKDWIDEVRDQISMAAVRRETSPRQFAATLAALLIAPKEILALHIGDSAIVGRCGSEWDSICWPENGEYASTTFFITDDPEPNLKIVRQERQYDAFALFSDGVGDLALSVKDRRAHPGFFNPMMRPVDGALASGRLPELSLKLRSYLAGSSVCERTDDDKTLVLLSGV
ncbi:PP2C family serine/threonine-protein phosphatase [Rhodovulum kholense]|uniref:Protein phosphatase 2C-like protein n=1 Tax=Rhodovulum kholense TaxID=453584 RepID=A0A8E2VI70_9RHOB|nr:PP2C family serine/threonine-protein phosphatase [Rhodovulum kholense]PTW45712.1 protein phosphatase 2C-like protein [Rhodovulum kholense]